MNNSKNVIADNILRIQSMRQITLNELSNMTEIKLSTLKAWSKRRVYPRLKTLDKFCNKLHIHTSDLLEENTCFETPYTGENTSHQRFYINFKSLCNNNHLLKVDNILSFLNNDDEIENQESERDTISIDAFLSYKRKTSGRQIPIKKLDYIADRFNIKSYMLLR